MTMHMSHNPLIWLISDTEARGIFLYEDNNTYRESKQTAEGFSVYCDDFRKCEDGIWRISTMRIGYRKMEGELEDYDVPEGWTPNPGKNGAVDRSNGAICKRKCIDASGKLK